MPAIAIRHLSKTFEQKGNSVEALRDISLDIEEGDIYGIIGMSGAGKSTLVRCLNYLERPTSGEVIIGGRDLGTLTEKDLREQRSDIAMIFQHFNLLMQKSVLDNVCFPMQIAKKKKDEAKKRKERLSCSRLSDLPTRRTLIRHSFPADRSREWRSPELLRRIRRFCSATRQPVP